MRIITAILTLVITVSCSFGVQGPTRDDAPKTWAELFEAWHEEMNRSYVLFDLDSPSDEWDKVLDEYMLKFEGLDEPIGDSRLQTLQAYRFFYDVVALLSDGHYSLQITDDINDSKDRDIVLSPSAIRKLKAEGADDTDIFWWYAMDLYSEEIVKSAFYNETPENIIRYSLGLDFPEDIPESVTEADFPSTVLKEYILVHAEESQPSALKAFEFMGIIGMTNDDILYIMPSSFPFAAYHQDTMDGKIDGEDTGLMLSWRERLIDELDAIRDGRSPAKGIVIDLRGNRGGYSSDLTYIWGNMLSKDITIGYTRRKIGPNRHSYGAWQPWIVSAASDKPLDIPIVVLVNSTTASCGELSTMIFHALAEEGYNVTIMGAATMGAHGAVPGNAEEYNAGSFSIEPWIKLTYTAGSETVYRDGVSYEGKGIPVDIEVPWDYEAFMAGNDARLSAGLAQVLK